jgi:hypothetical protein
MRTRERMLSARTHEHLTCDLQHATCDLRPRPRDPPCADSAALRMLAVGTVESHGFWPKGLNSAQALPAHNVHR